MSGIDLIASLLADLDTLTRVSEAGVLSRREARLEPGETRHAAILFLDLVGFTELSRVLTSQQLTTLVDRAFRIFELTVQGHGGYWDARFGDAALYVFPGHPSYAPACEGALLAAMALLDRARLIAESLSGAALERGPLARNADEPSALQAADTKVRPTAFNIRVGVAFGEVTRQQVGGRQYTVMGDTVNLAQRLEASAEPGSCQTTLRVLDQAGESMVADYRGDITLKGFGVVQVQRLSAVRPRQLQLRGSTRELSPLIGRDAELGRAAEQIEKWLDGGAGLATKPVGPAPSPGNLTGEGAGPTGNKLLLIEGPTAVGKSRFAWELLGEVSRRRPVLSATAHCTELASLIGFAVELLHVAGLDRDNFRARWEELCQQAATQHRPEYTDALRPHLGTLALLLGVSGADAAAISQLEPQSFLRSVQAALKACLELAELESQSAILLIIEDLQWLGTLHELLSYLLSEVRLSRPLVFIATSRQPDLPVSLADTGVEASRCHLPPLNAAQGAQLFSALLPGLDLPAEVEEELHEKAIGLPYYYEEFARMLLRRGIVTPAEDSPGARASGPHADVTSALHYVLAAPITELHLPEDLQMLILGGLDQLEPHLRDLTGRASVLGRSFSAGTLRQIEERLGHAHDHDLDAQLTALVEQHVMAREGGRYFFRHLLTQQAAYSALLLTNRQLLHALAARGLEEQLIPGSATEADILPELATHLLRAGLPADAHRRACQLLSLKAATGRFENWEQWEVFARASWFSLRADNEVLPEDSHALLSAQAARHVTQGQWEDALAHYEAALQQARGLQEPAVEAALLCSLGGLLRGRGDFAEAEGSYLRALLLAREQEHPQLEAVALRDLGTLKRERGLHNEALDYLLRALEASRACNDRRSEAVVLDSLGLLYMDRFMADAAHDALSQALALGSELRSPWTEGLVLADLGLLHMKYMRFAEARTCLDRALELARSVGDPRLEGEVAGKRANLLLRLGELESASPELARAEALLGEVGNPFQLGFVHCQWTHLHLALGAPEEARASLTRARRIARTLKLGEGSALEKEIARAEAALEQGAPATKIAQ